MNTFILMHLTSTHFEKKKKIREQYQYLKCSEKISMDVIVNLYNYAFKVMAIFIIIKAPLAPDKNNNNNNSHNIKAIPVSSFSLNVSFCQQTCCNALL